MLKQLKTIKERVKGILEEYPKARNSDTNMLVVYTATYYPNLIDENCRVDLREIFNHINPESCRRSRQKIQEKAYTKVLRGDESYRKYLPDDKTVLKRRKMERVYSQFVR